MKLCPGLCGRDARAPGNILFPGTVPFRVVTSAVLCGRDARAPGVFFISCDITFFPGGSDNGAQTGNILYTVVRERCLSGLIEVVEIGVAVPGFVRAGRPRSRVVVMETPL